jgi:hypothetical protein
MARKRAGRAAKPGKRTKSGRLSAAGVARRVEPNDRVLAVRDAFRWFQDGKADQQVHDPIGRAWAVGLLDGFGADPAALRDAVRTYGEGYWSYYAGLGIAMGGFEGASRSSGSGAWADPRGRRFEQLDAAVDAAGASSGNGRAVRDALHNVAVDHHWFPDENPLWLDRLIVERRVLERSRRMEAKLLPAHAPGIAGALPKPGDAPRLAALAAAALALVMGSRRREERARSGPSLAVLTCPPDLDEVPAGHETTDFAHHGIDPAFVDEETGQMKEMDEIAAIIRERLGPEEEAA